MDSYIPVFIRVDSMVPGQLYHCPSSWEIDPDSKVHGANMWPTRVLSAPDRPYVGPMNFAIRGSVQDYSKTEGNEDCVHNSYDVLLNNFDFQETRTKS